MPEIEQQAPLDINNKSEFLLRKTSWLDLIALTLKCLILYYLEIALKHEAERLLIKAKQENEINQRNRAEQLVNRASPSHEVVI